MPFVRKEQIIMASNTSTRDWLETLFDRFEGWPKGGKIASMVLGLCTVLANRPVNSGISYMEW